MSPPDAPGPGAVPAGTRGHPPAGRALAQPPPEHRGERPHHLRLVWRQYDYWRTVYRRTWRGSVVNSFLAPVLYLTALGVLLGKFIDAAGPGRAALSGADSYLQFVAPGLLAAHAMQIAMGEVLWPVMGMIKWNKAYFGMISTPLRVVDVFGAHMGFVLFRVATTVAAFMIALTFFGVYRSWWLVLPAFGVQLLIGMAFATPFFAVAAKAQRDSMFAIIFRVVVMPLFLFSGAFFPLANLAEPLQWMARATPLWHGVELTRMCFLDTVHWPMAAVHTAYLAVLTALGGWWSVRRLTRRLIA